MIMKHHANAIILHCFSAQSVRMKYGMLNRHGVWFAPNRTKAGVAT